MNNIYSFIKDREQSMLQTLRFLVEMESPSNSKSLNDALGFELSKLFEELVGGSVIKITNKTYGDHYRAEWGQGDTQILILTHFDTVWPEQTIERKPFEIKEGKVYGPGVFDMKGGITQGLYALKALSELKEEVGCKVVFLFTSDEEVGSPTSQTLIEDEAKKSKFVLVLEPGMSTTGSLKTSRKGVGIFQLQVKGKPSHSGLDPYSGRSAIEELAHQTLYLHNLSDFETGTTVNVGVVNGGTTSNVIAAEANADIDLRVKTKEEFDRVEPLIKGLKTQVDGTSLSVSGGINRPPLEKTEDVHQLFQIAKKLAKNHMNYNLTEKETGGGSDGNFSAPLAPTLDGLGAVGDGAHAEHEHLVISEMSTRSTLLALLIRELSFN
ncbi:M20 family metallopeptidase [Virgibacillus byunsanensis]|uniref:M20 family metallopeptidase n=1 Tax=Virgibacillus byunsanensis TaxID=570945 RepID=A0ABW3LIB5_9BACI